MTPPLPEQTIDNELRWREIELALAKLQLHKSINTASFNFSYRCFVTITYAHFEGFSKQVLAQSLLDISKSGVLPSKFTDIIQLNFLVSHTRKNLQTLSNVDFLQVIKRTSAIFDSLTFPSIDQILDCGNMNFENFNWAISCVGLSPEKFSEFRSTIGHLVNLRHECAHGEYVSLDGSKTATTVAKDMFSLQEKVITLMHLIAVELVDHFQERRFCSEGVSFTSVDEPEMLREETIPSATTAD